MLNWQEAKHVCTPKICSWVAKKTSLNIWTTPLPPTPFFPFWCLSPWGLGISVFSYSVLEVFGKFLKLLRYCLLHCSWTAEPGCTAVEHLYFCRIFLASSVFSSMHMAAIPATVPPCLSTSVMAASIVPPVSIHWSTRKIRLLSRKGIFRTSMTFVCCE